MPTRRFNSRPCRSCKTVTSVLATCTGRMRKSPVQGNAMIIVWTDAAGNEIEDWRADQSRLVLTCRGCGVKVVGIPVLGKTNPKKVCNDRCMSATGHSCECACGGVNHGAQSAA